MPLRVAKTCAFWTSGAIVALIGLSSGAAYGQAPGGFSPEDAARRMVVPNGFHVEIVAAEPMVRQPVAACFDERGRIWVIEYLQYPNPAGLKPVTVDQYLRTEYDRFPEPPPKGPRGADRIKVLEDTDGDGRCDKETVFVEGLNLASSLAVGHGGVFVGQAPYLLFFPDRNHDDRPDADPEVLLTGFGLQDAHATVNSMAWGPDGWLYGAQGSTVTARIRGIEFQQGIWRYHPRSHQFELFAEGGGNTWGLDFDAGGNAFGSSNGAYITFHMVQGGYYLKGFAKHGPLHNPHTYGYFGPIAYDGLKLGGHVTPGGIIYQGDAYPPEFRGAFIGGNLLSNAVYWHTLRPDGSTFRGRHGGTLIDARDTWFRPIDLLTGPDGCVYLVDWYDRRAAHLDPRDTWDRTNGRIYRVVHGARRKVPPFDLARLKSDELVDLRTSKNDWWSREARRVLTERRDAEIVPRLKQLLASDQDESLALRDLWALNVSGGLDDATALRLLEHPLAGVRRWTIRLLGDERKATREIQSRLISLGATEPTASVRAQLAASCQRWEPGVALPILEGLLSNNDDKADPFIPMQLWWAIERQLRSDRAGVISLLTSPGTMGEPLVREYILERLARVLGSDASPAAFQALSLLLERALDEGVRDRLYVGLEKGLEGRRLGRMPDEIAAQFTKRWLASQPRPAPALIRLGLRLGSPEAERAALDLAHDVKSPIEDRVAVIEVVGQLARPESLGALLKLLDEHGNPTLQAAVIAALGGFTQPEIARNLLENYPRLTPIVRDRAVSLLCGRREWASQMIAAMTAGQIPAKSVTLAQVQQISRHGDPTLVGKLESLWGKIPRTGSPEKIRRIAEVRGLLPEGDKGNAARGKPIFKEQCAGCHKLFGEGEAIGPELTGADRGNLDFLLTSLVDPSASVRKEYQAQSIALKDGRVLSGLVIDENDQTLTLVGGDRQRVVVPRSQVDESKPSETSIMPEGVLDKLPEPQIRDLFRYLQSNGVP